MNNQDHEIISQKMNEIESLNEIVELDDIDLEIISGGSCGTHSETGNCTGKIQTYIPEPNEIFIRNLEVQQITLDSGKIWQL